MKTREIISFSPKLRFVEILHFNYRLLMTKFVGHKAKGFLLCASQFVIQGGVLMFKYWFLSVAYVTVNVRDHDFSFTELDCDDHNVTTYSWINKIRHEAKTSIFKFKNVQ